MPRQRSRRERPRPRTWRSRGSAPRTKPHTFVALSRDAGRTFGAPARVDEVSAIGHVGVELLNDGSAAVSWIEFANQRAQFKIRRIEPDGGRTSAVLVAGAGDDRVAGSPRLVQAGDELVFAWTETTKRRVARANGTDAGRDALKAVVHTFFTTIGNRGADDGHGHRTLKIRPGHGRKCHKLAAIPVPV